MYYYQIYNYVHVLPKWLPQASWIIYFWIDSWQLAVSTQTRTKIMNHAWHSNTSAVFVTSTDTFRQKDIC